LTILSCDGEGQERTGEEGGDGRFSKVLEAHHGSRNQWLWKENKMSGQEAYPTHHNHGNAEKHHHCCEVAFCEILFDSGTCDGIND
jgi:hypothetical protein